MLIQFRKAASGIFVKILLGLIAFSFVAAGAASFLRGNSSGDVVVFSNAPSIPVENFLALKAKEIERIQYQNNTNLTEEQINSLDIDRYVLQSLINEAMIKYLAKIYDLDITEKEVLNFVKQVPHFKNQNNEFDIKLFKDSFRNSKRLEEEYLATLKNDLIKTVILDVFMGSFVPSKQMIDNIVYYLAETKYFDVITIDLARKPTGFKFPNPTEEELRKYYKNNEDVFVVAENRSFDYLIFDKEFFLPQIKVNEAEVKSYYEENKNDFDNKSYDLVKREVKEILFNNKFDELITDLVKKLEEEVASGVSLKDLSARYGVKNNTISNIGKEELIHHTKLNFPDFVNSLFEMAENEVSYPIESPEQDRFIIVELKKITPSRQQEFNEVKGKIFSVLEKQAIIEANLGLLQAIHDGYTSDKAKPDLLKSKDITIKKDQSITFADIEFDQKINPELAQLIFKTNEKHVTKIVEDGKNAYFAYVKGKKRSENKAKKIFSTSSHQIINNIKENIMQEMLGYLTEENNMQIYQKGSQNR